MSRKRIEKELVALLKRHSSEQEIPVLADDLFAALRLEGDEVSAFFDEFASQFDVDMAGLLLYFHDMVDESPLRRRLVPYLPNGQIALYQPITFSNLADAAQTGRWEWDYPPHSLKTVGWKDVLQYILIAIVAVWIVASFFL